MNKKLSLSTLIAKIDWVKTQGLIPAIIQHAQNGQILMMGYMDQTALTATFEKKHVTFWSRTKKRLWTKGETSGNRLQVQYVDLDCDKDTLLIQVIPTGNTCHLGSESCFGNTAYQSNSVFLHQLERVIDEKRNADPAKSYTASLYQKGTKRIAQKVGEEGVEVALAAVTRNKEETLEEVSDLLYHLLVLLQDQGLSLNEVLDNLKARHKK